MNNFREIVEHFQSQPLTRLTDAEAESVRQAHAGISSDYIRFLREVGYGNIGGMQIYSRPVNAPSVYGSPQGRLAKILLIGDDLQGYCLGFDPAESWRLVEISPSGNIDLTIEPEFLSFLRSFMGKMSK